MYKRQATADAIHAASQYGFDTSLNGFNWTELKQNRDAYIERLNGIYANNLVNNGVDHIEGKATFIDPHTIQVGNKKITAERFLIATGGKPSIPDIPGAEHGITSDGFFELETQPNKVAVIGAGFIAVELAGVFQSLGTQVSLVIRGEQALRQFDSMLGKELAKAMAHQGITLETNRSAVSIEKNAHGKLIIHTEHGILDGEFDEVLWAIGRDANTEGLNLKNAQLETNSRGFIETNEWQETAQKSIYAVGDVTGRIALTPVAIAAARRLSDRLFNKQSDRKLDYNLIPSVIFSHPPIGTIAVSYTHLTLPTKRIV